MTGFFIACGALVLVIIGVAYWNLQGSDKSVEAK
jgi:CHASE3 domain sensor protein